MSRRAVVAAAGAVLACTVAGCAKPQATVDMTSYDRHLLDTHLSRAGVNVAPQAAGYVCHGLNRGRTFDEVFAPAGDAWRNTPPAETFDAEQRVAVMHYATDEGCPMYATRFQQWQLERGHEY